MRPPRSRPSALTASEGRESFLRCHTLSFQALGGVPRSLLYDNLKSVVLERVGDHIRSHPKLLEFAGHDLLPGLNAQLSRWIEDTAHARPLPGDTSRRVHQALQDDVRGIIEAHPRSREVYRPGRLAPKWPALEFERGC